MRLFLGSAVLAALIAIISVTVWRYRRPIAEKPVIREAPMVAEAAPYPVSIRELVHNLTDYGPAGGPPMIYKGYYNLDGAEPRQLKLELTADGWRLDLQRSDGNDLSFGPQDLRLFRFKADEDSLVIILPDQRMLYFKYSAALSLSAFPQALKAWTGWAIKNRSAVKIVLIENVNPTWPRLESLREAAPPGLPY